MMRVFIVFSYYMTDDQEIIALSNEKEVLDAIIAKRCEKYSHDKNIYTIIEEEVLMI